MEIGSFIELQFPKGKEYFTGGADIARLNSGRAAIYHAALVLGCRTVWVPHYQCDTVRDFLLRHGMTVRYYHIDPGMDPVDIDQRPGEAVILVNYFGVMSHTRMRSLAARYQNVIIDNSPAFFCPPVENCMNVYSARKFVGVPDGAYVAGKNAHQGADRYPLCHSSDTSLFLLQRIEYGCEGKTYASRSENEHRIDREDVMRMSKLTHTILDGTDYEYIRQKRRENFEIAQGLFGEVNLFDPLRYYDETCVPMAYPLVVEDDGLNRRLIEHKHFQGQWWSYVMEEVDKDSFEYWLCRYINPVTIDQRYGAEELRYIREVLG